MVTALGAKNDRIRGIEAGSDDFVTKPFDMDELLARINMLLAMRDLDARLGFAYNGMKNMNLYGRELLQYFDPLNFSLMSEIDKIVNRLIRIDEKDFDRPEIILVGVPVEGDKLTWHRYHSISGSVRKRPIHMPDIEIPGVRINSWLTSFYNEDELDQCYLLPLLEKSDDIQQPIENMVTYIGTDITLIAMNYGKKVGSFDASVLDSFVFQMLLLKVLSERIKEVESAFEYTVQALARASEANDEDTGNHILRVGEYCAALAEKLGYDDKFIREIKLHAMMHDVGKISVPPSILKKPGKLTDEEFEEMKNHTLYGAKILGDHPMLKMSKVIALTHHEKIDGSGYPYGLSGDQIPLEGRIMPVADIYDALRNARVYKPAFDHEKSYKIMTEGDGRTLPSHFDPAVLDAFKACAPRFMEIYEKLKD